MGIFSHGGPIHGALYIKARRLLFFGAQSSGASKVAKFDSSEFSLKQYNYTPNAPQHKNINARRNHRCESTILDYGVVWNEATASWLTFQNATGNKREPKCECTPDSRTQSLHVVRPPGVVGLRLWTCGGGLLSGLPTWSAWGKS